MRAQRRGRVESLMQLNESPLCPHSAGDSQRTGQEEKGKRTRPSTSDGINNTVLLLAAFLLTLLPYIAGGGASLVFLQVLPDRFLTWPFCHMTTHTLLIGSLQRKQLHWQTPTRTMAITSIISTIMGSSNALKTIFWTRYRTQDGLCVTNTITCSVKSLCLHSFTTHHAAVLTITTGSDS